MFNNILCIIIFHKNFIILSLVKNIFYFHIHILKKEVNKKIYKKK
jgi:uncharacterized membrane protein YciS (DUF1049 family)